MRRSAVETTHAVRFPFVDVGRRLALQPYDRETELWTGVPLWLLYTTHRYLVGAAIAPI